MTGALQVAAGLVCILLGRQTGAQGAATPATAHRPALAACARQMPARPNLDLNLYRRAWTPDERIGLSLSAYNEHQITFTCYRISLQAVAPTPRTLNEMRKRLDALDLRGLPAARTWSVALGKVYPDQWSQREVKMPALPPGVYVVQGAGAGAERRTWVAVTAIALLAKRSGQRLLVYAADAETGRPVASLPLHAVNDSGDRVAGETGANGLWPLPLMRSRGAVLITGERGASPAFLVSGPPPPPDPYVVYIQTDRPVYRPSQRVQFKGTVRTRLADAADGVVYRPYADSPVTVEIRDATDTLIERKTDTTNAYGSFAGALDLAPEPPLGHWQIVVLIGQFRAYASFDVLAYRKPEFSVEVTPSQPHYLGGSTAPLTIHAGYYYGQPVSNANVQYTISFQQLGAGDASAEPPYQGSGVTDAHGDVKLSVRTKRLPFNRQLTVQATVTDLSRRSQTGTGAALITSGRFQVSVETDRQVYRPGETAIVTVHAVDYDGKPVRAPVQVRLIETMYDRYERPYRQTTERSAMTGAAGAGEVSFPLVRPGYLELTATAFDDEDDKIEASGYVWVTGEELPGYDYATLSLTADRSSYHPGDTATILVNTSLVGRAKRPHAAPARPGHPVAWALVTVEGDRLYSAEVVPIRSRTEALRVPVSAAYFPSVELDVTILQDRQVYSQGVRLPVEREDRRLSVRVVPARDHYEPGQTASYTIETRDYLGRPVPAEVALGVVDASIYAIRPDNTPDPGEFFYGSQESRIQTDFSFAAQYSGGAFQAVPGAQGGRAAGAAGIRVRRTFADTAYWNPFVQTDAGGVAQISFTMPDNLTTWRATAHGSTLSTVVGAATSDVVSSMPLLVRLELPRFYVAGDQARVSAVVHNYTGSARTVHVAIESAGARFHGAGQRTIGLGAGKEQRLDWSARIDPVALTTGPTAEARFRVTADGGPGGQDAVELTVPALPDGVEDVQSTAAALSEPADSMTRDLAHLPEGASITLTLAPSIGSAVLDALDYLTSYPYGCAEQTTSALIPDVVVAGTLRKLGVQHPVTPNLDRWVSFGLQKIYRYQHPDGGWNWWEGDQTDGDITAYVLWGLLQARAAGYTVDTGRILRGTEALLRMLADQREWNSRVEWLLTIAEARPAAAEKPLEEAFDHRDRLDTFGLATLCLALAHIDGAGRRMAATAARELERKAEVRGTTAFWPAEEGGYSWQSDDAFVTARAVRALLEAAPASGRIRPAVRWLMGNRVDKSWGSTRTTAEAVYATARYMELTRELQPDFTATVALDGAIVKRVRATSKTALDSPSVVSLSWAALIGHHTLEVTKSGRGVLYTTETTRYLIPSAGARPIARGIALKRTYEIPAEDPSRADTLASGVNFGVTVEVTADAAYRYAIVEDPIPAGCEVVNGDEDETPTVLFEGGTGYVRREVRDNRVVFFFDDLPKGRAVLSYRLHAETPGRYRALPGTASLAYFPEVRGSGKPASAVIGERPAGAAGAP